MAGWPALRYEWIQTVGGIMKVGDLVKTHDGEYAIIAGFGIGDVSGTKFVQVYLNDNIIWLHPGTLEVICK